ncbi:MAG TPA: hypothetical protein VG713_08225, partial [Pirellulales bacterium]|nr:hypothetical protein [Pirellulales bacterium]
MSAHVLRIDLSQGACDFEPIALEPGVPMLDRSGANYVLLRRWCGDLVAEPSVESSDGARFFLRNEPQGRLAEVTCLPASMADLSGPCKSDVAALLECLQQAKASSPHEQALLRTARSALMNAERRDDLGQREGCFVKYRETGGPWRLAWCWGFRRKHSQPASAAICKNSECRQLFLHSGKGKARCPGCAVTTTPARNWRPMRKNAIAALAIVVVAAAIFSAGRKSTRYNLFAGPWNAEHRSDLQKGQSISATAREASPAAGETSVAAATPVTKVEGMPRADEYVLNVQLKPVATATRNVDVPVSSTAPAPLVPALATQAVPAPANHQASASGGTASTNHRATSEGKSIATATRPGAATAQPCATVARPTGVAAHAVAPLARSAAGLDRPVETLGHPIATPAGIVASTAPLALASGLALHNGNVVVGHGPWSGIWNAAHLLPGTAITGINGVPLVGFDDRTLGAHFAAHPLVTGSVVEYRAADGTVGKLTIVLVGKVHRRSPL